MGYGYDCAASVLLCAEDNSSILGFDDGDEVETCVEVERSGVLEERCHLYGEMFLGMPLISDECVELLVKKELDHLPRSDYAQRLISGALDLTLRTDAIDWISKAHAHYNFGPLSAYLAINFLDRFLSAYELPQGKAWMTQLLSVACLALAAKIDESEVPLSLDLQVGDSKYIFEARTIQRMELLVLSTLKWRLQSVTPFSYVDYFLHKFNDSKTPSTLSVSRSVELILSIMRGIDFLAFRPSEISAAVALSVLSQEQAQKPETDKVLTCYSHVIKKERVLRCCEMIQAKSSLMNSINNNNNNNNNKNRAFKNASSSGSFVPQSPIGVLDAACLSYKSDETTTTTTTTTTTNGIHANSDHTSPVNKKRRMNRHE